MRFLPRLIIFGGITIITTSCADSRGAPQAPFEIHSASQLERIISRGNGRLLLSPAVGDEGIVWGPPGLYCKSTPKNSIYVELKTNDDVFAKYATSRLVEYNIKSFIKNKKQYSLCERSRFDA